MLLQSHLAGRRSTTERLLEGCGAIPRGLLDAVDENVSLFIARGDHLSPGLPKECALEVRSSATCLPIVSRLLTRSRPPPAVDEPRSCAAEHLESMLLPAERTTAHFRSAAAAPSAALPSPAPYRIRCGQQSRLAAERQTSNGTANTDRFVYMVPALAGAVLFSSPPILLSLPSSHVPKSIQQQQQQEQVSSPSPSTAIAQPCISSPSHRFSG